MDETPIEQWLDIVKVYGEAGMTKLELYDLRNQSNTYSNEEIEKILVQTVEDRELRPQGAKTAVVVNTTLKFGLVRMYEQMAMLQEIKSETQVFYDIDKAVEWLGEQVKEVLKIG
jgi:hypothetical protein